MRLPSLTIRNALKEIRFVGSVNSKHLIDLYELIILEWIQEGYKDVARELLRKSDPMDILRNSDPDRYVALEALLSRPSFDSTILKNKQERRKMIADKLHAHLKPIPPSRLVSLVGQALKWQISQNMINPDEPYDLVLDQVPFTLTTDDEPIQSLLKTIKV